jgi:RimJ/RimL family protein N-acetyltransferase
MPSSRSSLDASFSRCVTLSDGRRVRLRWIRPSDAALVREGFERLSLKSRWMRFFVGLHELSEPTLRYLTDVDGTHHVALIAVEDLDGGASERALGTARFVRDDADPRVAELAVTVTDDAQGRGLGRRLLAALADAAEERGIRTFTMAVLADNVPVRRMLERLGAVRRSTEGDVSTYTLDTRRASRSARLGPREPRDAPLTALPPSA